ncbi:MAG: thiamine biosynthesis protein [Desulfobulbaceae bacterium]|nr:thiamine biosynthesis protein [Desulfobulbaceae bacterium]
MTTQQITALALFSGGLDSILACRVMMAQDIRVKAVKFVTPFFGYELLARAEEHIAEVRDRYGIDLCLHDVSKPFLEMLKAPPHGYGRNFNPCIDCKILLVSTARKMMPEMNASLLISGEVVGQRPMSQRRDTLRLIERDSGCHGLLLRPLCAKSQPPTKAETEGLVDRQRLHDLHGRGRHGQIELAASFGITDYPDPAGGCILTDPIKSKQIARYYRETAEIDVHDLRLLLIGRQIRLPNGGWLALGRDEEENTRLLARRRPGDLQLEMEDRPGPAALLRHGAHPEDRELAARLVVRYARKGPTGPMAGTVHLFDARHDSPPADGSASRFTVEPLADQIFRPWLR